MLFKILTYVVIIYAFAILFLYLFQNKIIFYPQPTAPANLTRFADQEIRLSHGGTMLTGWFFNHGIDAQQPLIIYFGGNAEDVSLNFDDLQLFDTGSFLFMNYRGFGCSEGRPSEKALFDDALFVLDHFIEVEKINPKHIVLMGRSLGTGVAVHVAAQRKVGGVILVTPFTSLVSVARSHYPVFPVGLLLKHRFDSEILAPGISTAALFLIAENDQVVPGRFASLLAKQWGGPKTTVVVTGTDHNTIETSPAYWKAINTYLYLYFNG